MSVINITVEESSEQIVSGIPKTVAITTNIPSTIFYTLDGSVPTIFSSIYISTIFLPTNKLSVTLNIFASNGTDTSPILTELYETDILNNTRLPHSPTDVPPGTNIQDLYPFGTNINEPLGTFLNPGDAGTNVFDPSLPATNTGFDGDGYETGFTNKPFNSRNYYVKFSDSDVEGNRGPGIGNLPQNVIIEPELDQPEETDQFSNFFDPRAFVIFQDSSKENPGDPPNINKMYFSSENPETARDGNAFFTTGLDTPPPSGSFVNRHYNPRDNTLTSYFFDSWSNKWVISKSPYIQTGSYDGNLSGIFTGRDTGGAGIVVEWSLFARRVLF